MPAESSLRSVSVMPRVRLSVSEKLSFARNESSRVQVEPTPLVVRNWILSCLPTRSSPSS